jgi:hypothetical protein
VRRLHPDVNRNPDSTARFMQVTESYQVLSDPERRRNYDGLLRLREQPGQQVRREQARRAADAATQRARQKPPPRRRPSTAGVSQAVKDRIAAAQRLYASGLLREAEKAARSLVTSEPTLGIGYAILGDIYRTQQKWDRAAKMYSLAIQFSPHDASYQRRYEQILDKLEQIRESEKGIVTRGLESARTAIGVSMVVHPILMGYVAFSTESPAQLLGIVSYWTPGLYVMLFLSGAINGFLLSASSLVDRWESLGSHGGRVSWATTCVVFSAVSFWAALVYYGITGLLQEALTPSLNRVFASSILLVLGYTIAFAVPQPHGWSQVAMWGGNLVFIGSLCGWRVMDAFKG